MDRRRFIGLAGLTAVAAVAVGVSGWTAPSHEDQLADLLFTSFALPDPDYRWRISDASQPSA